MASNIVYKAEGMASGDRALWNKVDSHSQVISDLDKRMSIHADRLRQLQADHLRTVKDQADTAREMQNRVASLSTKMDDIFIVVTEERAASKTLGRIIPLAFAAVCGACGVTAWLFVTFGGG